MKVIKNWEQKEAGDWTKEKVIIVIEGVIAREVTAVEAMDWVWDERNNEEHPLHIYDLNGNEIAW